MGFGFWVVAAIAGAGGYYAFRRLQELEEEIREEIDRKQEVASAGQAVSPAAAPPAASPPLPVTREDQVLSLVRTRPGRLQTDLYRDLGQVPRRDLQALLLELDRAGRIRRVKEKSTYKLYPG